MTIVTCAANILQIDSLNVLTTSGFDASKHYLVEVCTDTTNPLWP